MLAAGLIATLASTLEVPTAFTHTLWAVSGATLVWLFAIFPPSRTLAVMDTAGQRAYSFYLLHQPITLMLGPLALLLPGPGMLVLAYGGLPCLLITCVATEILFRFVERPSHRAAQRRFPRVYRETPAPRLT
jgi:peptidoglycan/LPS O-acetylase OafA/YrhL